MRRELAHLDRLPPGDRAVRIRQIARDHLERLAVLERTEPDRRTPGIRAGITKHRRALASLEHIAVRHGVQLPPWRSTMDNPRPRPNVTPDQAANAAVAALEHAADKLASLGVSQLAIGRALVGVGIGRMTREMGAGPLVDELAGVVGGLAAAAGLDLAAAAEQPSTSH
jgi:hypothetical protein